MMLALVQLVFTLFLFVIIINHVLEMFIVKRSILSITIFLIDNMFV